MPAPVTLPWAGSNRLCSASNFLHTRRTRYFHFFDCTHCLYALPVRTACTHCLYAQSSQSEVSIFPISLINCSFPNDVDTLGLRRYLLGAASLGRAGSGQSG